MFRSDLDKIIGYVDQDSFGMCNKIADHALVFTLQGLRQKWKQPVAYYFTKDAVKTIDLKHSLVEGIETLQLTGLKIICSISDKGSTNMACIKQ